MLRSLRIKQLTQQRDSRPRTRASSSHTYTYTCSSPFPALKHTHRFAAEVMAQSSRHPILVTLLVLLVEQSIAAPALAAPTEPAARSARLLDRFNHRYPDGSYEFRFELDDGTARYERGYFALINEVKTLMVVGYYSYRMPDGRYITVFYNADQFGYRQNQSITPEVYPNLPRSIEVPAPEVQPHTQLQQPRPGSKPSSSSHTASTFSTFSGFSTASTASTASSSFASSTPRPTALPTRGRGRF